MLLLDLEQIVFDLPENVVDIVVETAFYVSTGTI